MLRAWSFKQIRDAFTKKCFLLLTINSHKTRKRAATFPEVAAPDGRAARRQPASHAPRPPAHPTRPRPRRTGPWGASRGPGSGAPPLAAPAAPGRRAAPSVSAPGFPPLPPRAPARSFWPVPAGWIGTEARNFAGEQLRLGSEASNWRATQIASISIASRVPYLQHATSWLGSEASNQAGPAAGPAGRVPAACAGPFGCSTSP